MGSFRIEIQAVGGHGCDRRAQEGEQLALCQDPACVDCQAHAFVQRYKLLANIEKATLTHWPFDLAQGPEIVDDLLHGVRARRSFDAHVDHSATDPGSPTREHLLQFFDYEHLSLQFFDYEHLSPNLQAVSAPFRALARRMVYELPRSPERTAALRKLLEAKDCAVRALLAK